ncbi:MAG: hypothetical protein DME21_16810 [Verrucomicrobia bacterium]|nr:MAG: hypothetical protein DME21_16810 [Verrucomicrobiota bacterium]
MFPPGITFDTDLGRTKANATKAILVHAALRAGQLPCHVQPAEFKAKNASKAPESPTDHELSVAIKRTVFL